MRVSSPIGELPFDPTRLRVGRGGIEIDGLMGAWPAHVHVDYADAASLARLVPLRAAAGLAAGTCALVLARRLRRRRLA